MPYISEVKLAKAAACISDAAGQDTVTLPMDVAQELLRVALAMHHESEIPLINGEPAW